MSIGFQEWLVARSDASQHPGQAGSTLELARHLGPKRGERLLEIGCGSAKSGLTFADRFGTRTVGLDRAASSLERARSRFRRQGADGRIPLIAGDALALPIASSSLDLVIVESVAYAAPLEILFTEVRRVLRAGGRFGLVDIARIPGASPPEARFRRLLGEATLNLFTVEEWAGRVGAAGLVVNHAEGFPIRQELRTLRAEALDWIRSFPRQLSWLATSRRARRLFWANYRVGFDRGIQGCLLVATQRAHD